MVAVFFFGLKLNTWPNSAILNKPFIARRPRRIPGEFSQQALRLTSRQYLSGTTGNVANPAVG